MAAVGNAVWGWYEVVLGVGGAGVLSVRGPVLPVFAPPAIVGLLVLAKRPVTRAGWVCLGLDAWLIGGSLLTLAWSLALARAAPCEGGSRRAAALSLAYPLLDIVLVSVVLVLRFRRSQVCRSAANTAIGALALTVVCDALFTSPLLRESYALRAVARRGLVRRFAAARLRALGGAPARPDGAAGGSPTAARAVAPRAARRRVAGRAHAVPRGRGLHPGHPVQRASRGAGSTASSC
ncbi:hypothetical protein STANM309S_05817 [Streptomyces tanashiensis]